MSAALNEKRIKRPLYDWEIAQARLIFASALNYKKVRIHEFYRWPDQIDDIGRKLRKTDPRSPDSHNAITLCNGCYFPVGLPIDQPAINDINFYNVSWLIHELTHCWQYQKMGVRYLFLALRAQFKEGPDVYNIKGSKNLNSKRLEGWKITTFNVEQQAKIAETFYNAWVCLPEQQEMYDACLPYIRNIQGAM